MSPNTVEQDAATELLIAQLISADLDAPILDPLPTFPSIQEEEEEEEEEEEGGGEDLSTGNNDNSNPSPVPPDERFFQTSQEDEMLETAFRNILNLGSSATDWILNNWGAEGMSLARYTVEELTGHRGLEGNGPVATPPVAIEGLNTSSTGSSSRTTAPVSKGEGTPRLQQDEAVWWTPRRSGKAPAVEEELDDESENEDSEDGEDGGWSEDEGEDEDGNKGGEKSKGKDKEEFERENYDDIVGGIIWIPSPGERRVGDISARYTSEAHDTQVVEIIVGDDETLEGILAAMVL